MGKSKTYSRLGGGGKTFWSLINSLTPEEIFNVNNKNIIELLSDSLHIEIIQITEDKIQIKFDASQITYSHWLLKGGNKKDIIYGYYYNLPACSDVRNIANEGWKMSSHADFLTLTTFLNNGQTGIAGGKLKSTGIMNIDGLWQSPNTGADNSSKMTCHPNGMRRPADGVYQHMTGVLYFWFFPGNPVHPHPDYRDFGRLSLTYNSAGFSLTSSHKNWFRDGFGVRLIKESTELSHGVEGTYVGNDGHIYKTICVGSQEWLAENLIETKYRNGDPIPYIAENAEWAVIDYGARGIYNNDPALAYETNAFSANINSENIVEFLDNESISWEITPAGQNHFVISGSLNPSVIQKASPAEINTGTETEKLISPEGLFLSNYERLHFGDDPPADKTMIWGKYAEL